MNTSFMLTYSYNNQHVHTAFAGILQVDLTSPITWRTSSEKGTKTFVKMRK